MKQLLIIIAVVAVLALGFFFLMPSQTVAPEGSKPAPTLPTVSAPPSAPAAPSFDTNDNLDQALQDLEQVQ